MKEGDELDKAIDIEHAAKVMKLLGDKTRLIMLKLLEENELCVCEFVAMFQLSQPAVSQHLRKLRDAGLVQETRKGQWVFYSINTKNADSLFALELLKHIPTQDFRVKEIENQGLRMSCDVE